MNSAPLSQIFPAGCYIGFNARIDRRAAEQLALVVGDAFKNGYQEINLCLSSLGGVLDDAYYICNIIEAMPVRFVTYNIGNIASAANLLYLCGDKRIAVDGAQFIFHQTHFRMEGEVTEKFAAARLKGIQEDDLRSAAIISAKTGRSVKDIQRWQKTEAMFKAAAAIEQGIVHELGALQIPPKAFFHQVVI